MAIDTRRCQCRLVGLNLKPSMAQEDKGPLTDLNVIGFDHSYAGPEKKSLCSDILAATSGDVPVVGLLRFPIEII